MNRRPIYGMALPAFVVALAITGCNKEKPDTFMHALVEAVNGKPQAVWNELPASYQKDVKGLTDALAVKIDAKLWDDAFATLKKVGAVAQEKRTFVLALPQLKQMEVAPEGYDAAVKIIATIASSDISTHAGLKALNIEKFLSGTMATLITDIVKAGDVAAKAARGPNTSSQISKLNKMKTSVESISGNSAKVRIEMEGEQPTTEEFVKVEGKWIPKRLADSWATTIQAAKASIEGYQIPTEAAAAMSKTLATVNTALDTLRATKTEEEFNTQLGVVMQSFMPGAPPKEVSEPAMTDAATKNEAAPQSAPTPNVRAKKAKGKKGAR